MQELARINLVRIRELLHAQQVRDKQLALLWSEASAKPVVLRHSPARTVLRVAAEDSSALSQDWVLKLYHPHRSYEMLRRLISKAPALRELEAALRCGYEDSIAEQAHQQLGLFARPWIEDEGFEPDARSWGSEIAALHLRGWSDRDVSPNDFVWTKDGKALPLDFGSARFRLNQASPRIIQWRDLVRLLAAFPPSRRGQWLEDFVDSHEQIIQSEAPPIPWQRFWAAWPARFSHQKLDAAAARHRCRRMWRRSSRALRECSDFRVLEDGILRRGFEPPHGKLTILAKSTVAISVECGGIWQIQMHSMRDASCAHRHLHLLELFGLPAVKSLGYRGDVLWLDGSPLSLANHEQQAAIDKTIGLVNSEGYYLPDTTGFAIDADGQAIVAIPPEMEMYSA